MKIFSAFLVVLGIKIRIFTLKNIKSSNVDKFRSIIIPENKADQVSGSRSPIIFRVEYQVRVAP